MFNKQYASRIFYADIAENFQRNRRDRKIFFGSLILDEYLNSLGFLQFQDIHLFFSLNSRILYISILEYTYASLDSRFL